MKKAIVVSIGFIALVIITYVYISNNIIVFAGQGNVWSAQLRYERRGGNLKEIFTLRYDGESKEKIDDVLISYECLYGSYTARRNLDSKNKQIRIVSGGNSDLPKGDNPVKVRVEWNQQEEEFYLRSLHN
ncbi:MAG: hypothetical protein GXY40_04070 [Syntrophomonadaceae bacterium]|nr:hypothetical protein [Syntrophomonadaceae bacterium]